MYLYKRCFDLCYDMIDVSIYNLKYNRLQMVLRENSNVYAYKDIDVF